MTTEIRVPTLGESVTEATVATWFKKPGDAVAVDEMLCELETDKVSVEVPSPAAGVLTEITAEEGATVSTSAKLGVIGGSGAKPAAKSEGTETSKTSGDEETAKPKPQSSEKSDVENAPSANKLMAEKTQSESEKPHIEAGEAGQPMTSEVDVKDIAVEPATAPVGGCCALM